VHRIVTHCPHCLNSLRHDYPQFGGNFEVVHHSEFLADLIDAGRLPMKAAAAGPITLHDPCYLARVNGITRSPRRVLQHVLSGGQSEEITRVLPANATQRSEVAGPTSGGSTAKEEGGQLIEMARRGRDTACCGGGGGRMWFDDPPGNRVGGDRFDEIAATGAKTVAVACPFCLTMIRDVVGDRGSDLNVHDIAELLAASLDV
jgi:Fe-S oxidoreductase